MLLNKTRENSHVIILNTKNSSHLSDSKQTWSYSFVMKTTILISSFNCAYQLIIKKIAALMNILSLCLLFSCEFKRKITQKAKWHMPDKIKFLNVTKKKSKETWSFCYFTCRHVHYSLNSTYSSVMVTIFFMFLLCSFFLLKFNSKCNTENAKLSFSLIHSNLFHCKRV